MKGYSLFMAELSPKIKINCKIKNKNKLQNKLDIAYIV